MRHLTLSSLASSPVLRSRSAENLRVAKRGGANLPASKSTKKVLSLRAIGRGGWTVQSRVVSLSRQPTLPYLACRALYFLQSAKSKGDWDASKKKCHYMWEEGAIIEVKMGKKFLVGTIISKLQNGQFSSSTSLSSYISLKTDSVV
jgi:hypothetical protein